MTATVCQWCADTRQYERCTTSIGWPVGLAARHARRRASLATVSGEPASLLEDDLEVLADPGREAGLADREVVVPHPDEPFVEAHRADRIEPAEERRAPCLEGPDVVRCDVVHVADQQVGPVERTLDDRQRREQAAGEDVRLDPVRATALRLVGDVREGDRLEAHPPAGDERAIARLEEGREVVGADGLQHLDRDDRVIGARRSRGSRAARRSRDPPARRPRCARWRARAATARS